MRRNCTYRLASLVFVVAVTAAHAASRAPVGAEHGMVVTAQQYATRVGVEVLKQGGNAVDAAVAVGYALAVVYPAAGNLGGGGFVTLQLADGRRTFIDFRETAPLAATADMYLDAAGNVVPGLSSRGHLAVGVPGTVAGLEYLREKYGTLPRARLIAPAIRLAAQGFVLEQGDVELLREGTEDFRKDAASAAIFLTGGNTRSAGTRFVQEDLARTLRNVSKRGAAGFYQGETASLLVASSKAGGGILTQADLDAYRVRELPPLECDYRGFHIVSAPPPSSGGVILCEMLHVLEGYPLADYGWGSARAVHFEIEAMRHAYVDRNHLLGDPAFVRNPLAQLLDKGYAERIRARIDPKRAGDSKQLRPGVETREGTHTTHYSIADVHGNAIAVTYTLNDWFGARVTAKGTGVLLNDEMDDFTAKPGVPNMYGLVQDEANKIEPGKRPLSSMTPTIVLRDGKPWMVVGTPGGSRIITAVMLTMLNVIDYGMDIQEAVDAPRIHQQWLPEATFVEARALSPDTAALLTGMGHQLTVPQPENHVAAILIGAPALNAAPVGTDKFYGAIDPRRDTGLALGY
ncbi:MAG TPA: gamma-glutamyltransferase [Steroidobacteraceae bacterium]|nr:gamma-glutamyltransferase [Steroidobacteraceae bacterium]